MVLCICIVRLKLFLIDKHINMTVIQCITIRMASGFAAPPDFMLM